MILKIRLLAATGAIAAMTLTGAAAQAAGFYIQEQSVTGLGRAFAGQAAMPTDSSVLSFNPAAITELPSAEVNIGGHLLIPGGDPKNNGTLIPGSDPDNPYDPTLVPHGHAVYPLMGDRLWLGLAITAPFGLSNEYDEDWIGRYDSTSTDLQTINIQPSVAYKVNDWLSIGGGIDIQRADAELKAAIPNPVVSPTNPATDGEVTIKGDDWSFGFNAGILVQPREDTRIGLHYRSGIDHELDGSAEISGFTGPLAGLNADIGGSADLDLPSIASLAVAHDVNDKLTIAGSVTRYDWSSFETILVELDGTLPTGATTIEDEQHYEDTWAFAIGAEYALNDAWTLRTGFQFDETPTVDEFRTTRTPDGDRYWLAVGASYELNESFVIDAGYTHIFVEEVDVDQVSPAGVPTHLTYDNSIDIVSVGLRYRF